jgi:PKD repeat protein
LADYYLYPGSSIANVPNILLAGGRWNSAGVAGVGSWSSFYDASYSDASIGARPEFRDSNVTAAFNGTPLTGLLPLTVIFVSNSSGYPTSWYWEFGDGTVSTSQNPTHTYTSSGIYDVNLRIMDETSTDWENKSSYIFAPSVNFTATPTDYSCPTNVYNKGVCEVNVAFADTTNGPANTYFNWSFGDNTWFNTSVASLRNPTHKYSMIGTYSPSFSVTNTTTNASNTYTLTKVDYIHIGESPTGGSIGYSIYNDMPGMMLYISAMIILAIFVTVLMMWYRPKNW